MSILTIYLDYFGIMFVLSYVGLTLLLYLKSG
jgi:hypothetical protein